ASARYFPFQQTSVDVIAQDRGTKLAGEASLRIDVPENGNSYAGGYVIVDTEVDLSGYNAMSFYARGPSDANIGIIGFGLDADGDRDLAGVENIGLSTSWEKYYLPLPDPSRLEREDAIFFFSIGSEGSAFSIWLDDIRFETIEGLSNLTPLINNGEETQEAGYVGQTFFINTSYTFRGNSGTERTMTASPTYFDFTSSNENAAAVSQNGEIEITGDGSAEITASSTGTNANGSVSVQSRGIFDNFAPTPDKDPNDVLSVFSDAYTNEGGINPGVFANEEIGIELISIGDQNTLEYQEIAFVGIGWGNTADVTRYDFVHIDVYVSNPSNAALAIEIIDHGTDQVLGGSDDTAGRFTIASSSITNGEWIGLDIPLNGFTGNTGGGGQGNPALTNVGTVVLVAADGRRINTLVDNIYFYRQ
ncbi:MAG: hypothetical protein HRT61_22190, partial [Ekhidna sp.]|nr:hypothetical protein [Ekhidna sp.]